MGDMRSAPESIVCVRICCKTEIRDGLKVRIGGQNTLEKQGICMTMVGVEAFIRSDGRTCSDPGTLSPASASKWFPIPPAEARDRAGSPLPGKLSRNARLIHVINHTSHANTCKVGALASC